MTSFVALLRGINVGGRSLPMVQLRSICTTAGCRDVATYIQSGNVVFTHPTLASPALEATLERAILDATAFEVPVLVRTAAELGDIVTHNPFPGTEGTKLVVWFLRSQEEGKRIAPFDTEPYAPETLGVRGREAYMFVPNGQGRSRLLVDLAKIRPRVTFTARNWNTVERLLAMARPLA